MPLKKTCHFLVRSRAAAPPLLLLAAVLGCATAPGPAPASGPPGDPLSKLAWIAGHWFNDSGELYMEEYWLPPRGGLMLGLHRDHAAGRKLFFEYLRIEHTPEGILYQASPGGRQATPFELIESREGEAVFENTAHDFPQRILYRLDAEGRLHARIEGEEEGTEKFREWVYSRLR